MVTVERVIPVRIFKATHCLQGHEFTAANTKLDKNGYRKCRACDLLAAKRSVRKKRDAREAIVWPLVYALDEYERCYQAERKLARLRERFVMRLGHSPALIVGSKAAVAELEGVLRANPRLAARWEHCTLRADETIEDDCQFRIR